MQINIKLEIRGNSQLNKLEKTAEEYGIKNQEYGIKNQEYGI